MTKMELEIRNADLEQENILLRRKICILEVLGNEEIRTEKVKSTKEIVDEIISNIDSILNDKKIEGK
jgi:hypothetical protein